MWLDLRKSDTGWYTCKASSETGETTWSAALLVETPTDPSIIFHRTPEPTTFPGPPSRPSVADVTETSARLTWRSNPSHGASPVHAYTVEYFSHETGDVRCTPRSVYYSHPPRRSVPAPYSGGPPFRRSAIQGVRVTVRVNPSGPPEWRTGIKEIAL